MNLCKCGCNQFLPEGSKRHVKRGHVKNLPSHICLCGCKQICRKKFVHGHNIRNRIITDETRENIRQSRIKYLISVGKQKIKTFKPCGCGCGQLCMKNKQFAYLSGWSDSSGWGWQDSAQLQVVATYKEAKRLLVEDATKCKELNSIVISPVDCQEYLDKKTIFDKSTQRWAWKDLYEQN